MSKYGARNNDGEPSRDSRLCTAHDCPLQGSIGEPGHYLCRYHYGADALAWPSITSSIRENAWLVDLINDLHGRYSRGDDKGIRAMVEKFWGDSDHHMLMSRDESVHPQLYMNRLDHELAWRVGTRKSRPDPADARRAKHLAMWRHRETTNALPQE